MDTFVIENFAAGRREGILAAHFELHQPAKDDEAITKTRIGLLPGAKPAR